MLGTVYGRLRVDPHRLEGLNVIFVVTVKSLV